MIATRLLCNITEYKTIAICRVIFYNILWLHVNFIRWEMGRNVSLLMLKVADPVLILTNHTSTEVCLFSPPGRSSGWHDWPERRPHRAEAYSAAPSTAAGHGSGEQTWPRGRRTDAAPAGDCPRHALKHTHTHTSVIYCSWNTHTSVIYCSWNTHTHTPVIYCSWNTHTHTSHLLQLKHTHTLSHTHTSHLLQANNKSFQIYST